MTQEEREERSHLLRQNELMRGVLRSLCGPQSWHLLRDLRTFHGFKPRHLGTLQEAGITHLWQLLEVSEEDLREIVPKPSHRSELRGVIRRLSSYMQEDFHLGMDLGPDFPGRK